MGWAWKEEERERLSWTEKLGREREMEGERDAEKEIEGERREVLERGKKGQGKQRRKRGQKGETGLCCLGG